MVGIENIILFILIIVWVVGALITVALFHLFVNAISPTGNGLEETLAEYKKNIDFVFGILKKIKYTRYNDYYTIKNKKYLKNLFIKSQHFLRPHDKNMTTQYILANKNCIICFQKSNYMFSYYDKCNNDGYYAITDIKTENLYDVFNTICNEFSFSSKVEDFISKIEKTYPNVISNYQKMSVEEVKILQKISYNNMSIAELIELPGINIGKANKIMKQLSKKQFNSLDEFINFAQISKEDAEEIKEMFNHDIKYISENKE